MALLIMHHVWLFYECTTSMFCTCAYDIVLLTHGEYDCEYRDGAAAATAAAPSTSDDDDKSSVAKYDRQYKCFKLVDL